MMTNTSRRLLTRALFPALLAVGAAAGCNDLLEDSGQPQGTLNSTSVQSLAGIEGTLIGAYRALDWNGNVGGNWGNTASNWVWGSVLSDEAYKGSEASDQPSINDLEAYNWSTANAEGYLNDKWRGMYEGINRANSTIRAVRGAGEGVVPAADATGMLGEALFLRAHYHFEAWRMWGNVPYYQANDTDFRKANLPAAQVVTTILADLDSAIALLPTTPRNNQVGRATRWTALAYKGRVQVYNGQYADALTTLRQVRTSGPYALEETFERVHSGFQANSNGKETILAYQASSNDGEPNGNNANYGERLNFPHSGSPFGCCGFFQPSQNLVNYFATDANGLPIALSNANWNANNAEFAAGSATPVDPRLDWTVGRDGVPYKDWEPHAADWIRQEAYGGPYSGKKVAYEKASGSAQQAGGWAPAQQSSMNVHIFRYADMLLLLAEAEVEAGSLENARQIVNLIRARAGRSAQGCGGDAAVVTAYPSCAGDTRLGVPINDPSIRWATYRISEYPAGSAQFASQAAAREAVRAERRLELAMEGQRFFDLRRWGTYQTVLNSYLATERTRRPYLTAAQPLAERHRYFPIPQVQIDLSTAGGSSPLTQNPGWGTGN